jgi:hypothetical protein
MLDCAVPGCPNAVLFGDLCALHMPEDAWKMTQPLLSQSQWDRIVELTIEEVKRLNVQKGGEYAGDDDKLANFRRNAQALGLSMEHVWAVYAGKHWDAIQQYIKDLSTGRVRTRAEPIQGRVDDLIVYLLLFKGMCIERQPEPGIPWKMTKA